MDIRYFLELTDADGNLVTNWSQPYEPWSLRDIKAHCRAQLDCGKVRMSRLEGPMVLSYGPKLMSRCRYTFKVGNARFYVNLFEAPNGDYAHSFGAEAPESTDEEIEAYGQRLAMLAPWLYQD